MRVKHDVLIDALGEASIGGAWNFDHDNRKAWAGMPWSRKTYAAAQASSIVEDN